MNNTSVRHNSENTRQGFDGGKLGFVEFLRFSVFKLQQHKTIITRTTLGCETLTLAAPLNDGRGRKQTSARAGPRVTPLRTDHCSKSWDACTMISRGRTCPQVSSQNTEARSYLNVFITSWDLNELKQWNNLLYLVCVSNHVRMSFSRTENGSNQTWRALKSKHKRLESKSVNKLIDSLCFPFVPIVDGPLFVCI